MKTNQHIKENKLLHTLIFKSTIRIVYIEYESLLNVNKRYAGLLMYIEINLYLQTQNKKQEKGNEKMKERNRKNKEMNLKKVRK